MSDVHVNIGQNGQLRSSFLNGLNPPLSVPQIYFIMKFDQIEKKIKVEKKQM